MTLTRSVLDFWFGAPDSERYGEALDFWFVVSDAVDDDIRRRFADHLDPAAAGTYDAMIAQPEDALALTILLDQFPRNIFRGSQRSFAYDGKALSVARQALDLGHDRAVAPFQRTFLYLPFEHSEELSDQDRSVALFKALGDENGLDYAVRHRDIIRRFGRFPHRNAMLGRESTAEELEFLKQPGSSFGDKPAEEAEGS